MGGEYGFDVAFFGEFYQCGLWRFLCTVRRRERQVDFCRVWGEGKAEAFLNSGVYFALFLLTRIQNGFEMCEFCVARGIVAQRQRTPKKELSTDKV